MSNQLNNHKIAKIVYPDALHIKDHPFLESVYITLPSSMDLGNADKEYYSEGDIFRYVILVDYYSDWSVLMPLVVKHLSAWWKGADLPQAKFSRNKWTASYGNVLTPMVNWNDNPQEALADCLLQALEGDEID